MKLIKILATALILSTTATVTAHAEFDYEDRIEHGVRTDANYQANVEKAIKMLEAKGYSVKKVKADTYKPKRLGKPQPALEVEAYKNHVEYDIKLSYPELRILKERVDN